MPGARNKKGWDVAVREANPSFGDTIHLDVTAPDGIYPWPRVSAFQDDALVYSESIIRGEVDHAFTLGPTMSWAGGAAQGIAEVCEHVHGQMRVRASVKFEIGA